MVCKQAVTSKQEEGGLIGVCVGVWITLLQPNPAEEPIQLQLGDHFQFMRESSRTLCAHGKECVLICCTKQITKRRLLRLMICGMTVSV